MDDIYRIKKYQVDPMNIPLFSRNFEKITNNNEDFDRKNYQGKKTKFYF